MLSKEMFFYSPDGNEAGNVAPGQTETTANAENQEGQPQETSTTTTIDVAEFEKLKESVKKYSQNFDRINTEKVKLENELKKEREKNLSSKQIEEIQKAEYEEKLKRQAVELEEKNLIFEKSKMLFEKKWDNEFLDIVAGKDVESFSQNIEKLQDKIKKIVEEEVNKRLKTSNPVPNSTGNKDKNKYSLAELKKLAADNGADWVKKNIDKFDTAMTK